MDTSTKIRVVSFWELNKLKIIVLIIAVIIVLLLRYISKFIPNNLSPIFNNAGLVGIIGSVVGALIGSMTSFIGVIFTQRKQSESQAMITKKNTIYRPLYDDLAQLREILIQYPYPSYFEFKKGPQTIMPHPQFSAWERIKSDSRRIQVPKYLDDLLEEYTDIIVQYLKMRHKAAKDVQSEINNILKEKFKTESTIQNLGDVILAPVLTNNKDYILMRNYIDNALVPKVSLTDGDLLILSNLIYDRCNEIPTVKETKEIYIKSLEILDNIIDCMTIIINLINQKFEAYKHKYF